MLAATTIPVAPRTKDLLRALGKKGESYDAIIRRLVREAGWSRLDERWNKVLRGDLFMPLEDL